MEKYDVIIIGSGLGGLQCAYILSKHGMKVCVLEKHTQPGGCLQTFRRGKHTFDTGFHYVGGLDEGQALHRLFSYFDLMHLPWLRMDENCFDEVFIEGKSYRFANGYERFAETLSEQFPHQHKNLHDYSMFLREIFENIFVGFGKRECEKHYVMSLFSQSAYDFLKNAIDDPLLINVLSGSSMKMELNQQTLPLYIFAQINSSFIQSAWRLRGNASQITDSLIKSIESNGGIVRTNAEVTRLVEENHKISAVEINVEERLEANFYIADTHPAVVIPLIDEGVAIRKIYRKRINNLANTFGMFKANIVLKENTVPYLNRNIFVYEKNNVWEYADYKPENINACAMVSFRAPDDGSAFARNIDILTPMYHQEVERWTDTVSGRRGDDYLSYKNQKIEACLNLISGYVPGLANPSAAIDRIYTSTSLSYRDYTGAPDGSAFGIRKDCNQLMSTLLSPRTPEPNLFLTGQNLNLHGMLGVSMTSFFTCAEILGMDKATIGLEIETKS